MNLGIRHRGREYALKVIYSLQDQDTSIEQVLDDFWGQFRFREDVLGDPYDESDHPLHPEARRFAEEIVRGVNEHLHEIDDAISATSTNWSIERMARVDLSLMRLAAFELIYRPEIPINVVINEAIELGKRFGTKETPSFVNGILDKLSRTRPAGDVVG